MKIKKIFAGMAASAIALSMMAITASAAELKGNAGVEFQTNQSWNFRDWYGTGSGDAEFPGSKVGVQGGGAYGDADISDTAIDGSGDYTVSISANGTVTEKGTSTDAEKFWNPVDKNTTVTREGSPWSMAGNYKAVYDASFKGKEADVKQSDVTWEIDVATDKFNMLGVTTDIPVYYESDDDDVVHCYTDKSKGTEIKVSNLVVDMAGTEYSADEVFFKDDIATFGIALINTYGESSIDKKAAVPESGTVSISFHLELVEAGSGDTSSADSGSGSSGGSGNSGGSSNSGSSTTTSSASDTSSAADSTSSGDDWTPTDNGEGGDKSLEDALNAASDDGAASDDAESKSTDVASAEAEKATGGSGSTTTDTTTTTTTTTTTGGSSTTATGSGVSIGAVGSADSAADSNAEAASDATENAAAGVRAGVAFGFLALAGAVAVIAKKR